MTANEQTLRFGTTGLAIALQLLTVAGDNATVCELARQRVALYARGSRPTDADLATLWADVLRQAQSIPVSTVEGLVGMTEWRRECLAAALERRHL